jgi:DNA modification methylase
MRSSLRAAIAVSNEGALHYVCMDWRNVECLLAAGRDVYGATVNILVWVKTNAGQGSFYRSQHEFIVVFRVGKASHTNNIQLGRHGNNRSNVWRYAGVNTFRKGRLADLAAHPTVKPVAMIADAMKDCTLRGQNVLDTFCGSGSTILAAEKVGRRAFGLEIDPLYVDVAVRRWQAATGCDAVHAESGLIFEEVSRQRSEQSRHSSRRRAAGGRTAS